MRCPRGEMRPDPDPSCAKAELSEYPIRGPISRLWFSPVVFPSAKLRIHFSRACAARHEKLELVLAEPNCCLTCRTIRTNSWPTVPLLFARVRYDFFRPSYLCC